MLKWFKGCNTIDEVKKMYRKLAMQFHPDVCKNENAERDMKSINLEYEVVFKIIEKNLTPEQQKQYNKAGHNVNDGYREQVNKIIHIPNIIIEICGSWLWISGDTKPVKNLIKAAGFYWATKKKEWYWRPEEYKQVFNKKSMPKSHIRQKYGSEIIPNNPFRPLTD